jgi:hypothetical protein
MNGPLVLWFDPTPTSKGLIPKPVPIYFTHFVKFTAATILVDKYF